MTLTQLRDNFITPLLDGEILDDLQVLLFANTAKEIIEQRKNWRFLLKEDSSQTTSSSDTYLTTKTLPNDFNRPLSQNGMFVGINANSLIEFFPVLFEERRNYQNNGNFYYIDIGNSQFALIGKAAQSSTIYLNYTMFTPVLTALTDSFSSRWQDRFLPIIAYEVASLYRGGVDFDADNARMAGGNKAAAMALYGAMVSWDTRLGLPGMRAGAKAGDVPLTMTPILGGGTGYRSL